MPCSSSRRAALSRRATTLRQAAQHRPLDRRRVRPVEVELTGGVEWGLGHELRLGPAVTLGGMDEEGMAEVDVTGRPGCGDHRAVRRRRHRMPGEFEELDPVVSRRSEQRRDVEV